MNITPKFSLEELVIHEGNVYKITSVHAMNWFMANPYVYGVVLAQSNPLEPLANKELYVREGLLDKATDKQVLAWNVLYGPRRT